MINKAARFETKQLLKRTVHKQHGILDGIWFCGEEWRQRYNIIGTDFYLATWRIK